MKEDAKKTLPPQQKSKILNETHKVDAYAIVSRSQTPGSLNGKKLHTTQLRMTPELELDIIIKKK